MGTRVGRREAQNEEDRRRGGGGGGADNKSEEFENFSFLKRLIF